MNIEFDFPTIAPRPLERSKLVDEDEQDEGECEPRTRGSIVVEKARRSADAGRLNLKVRRNMKTFEPMAGTRIENACAEAISLSAKYGEAVRFEFNGVEMTAHSTASPQELVGIWRERFEASGKAYRESPEGIAAAAESQRREDERKQRDAAMKALDIRIAIKPGKEQEYADYKALNADDGYGQGVITYSEQWAYLMEKAMADGKALADVADALSHEADTEGVTGFMYGCAVRGLSMFWLHGEELRRWHNLTTQIKDEGERANESGGVLNPALLVIATQDASGS